MENNVSKCLHDATSHLIKKPMLKNTSNDCLLCISAPTNELPERLCKALPR